MQRGFGILLLLFSYNLCVAQSDSIQARIVLIGDAGELVFGRQPVIDAARDSIPMDSKTTVVFLGDNLYNSGLPDDMMPGYDAARAVLDSQIAIAQGTTAQVVFIPGNHDWNNEANDGTAILKRQEVYVTSQGKNIHFLPTDGCPGPVEYEVNNQVVLILYDSQWFIRKRENRPGIESDCSNKTEEEFYNELDDMLNKNSKKLVLLIGHHTLRSYGIHGGYFPIKTHIFPLRDISPKLWIPLPIIGSIYPIARGVFGVPEDLHYPAYANMITRIDQIVSKHKNVIFAGGHEHTLQLIKDSSHYYIVSGAGSKSTRVFGSKNTVYYNQTLGFATLEISKKKNVHIDYYSVYKDSVSHNFSENLFNFSSIEKQGVDSSTLPDAVPERPIEGSVLVAIDTAYLEISPFHKIIAGNNYRKEWGTKVNLKVFRINTEMGGFTIKSLGGGSQTQSLRLKDKQGREWVLRTVDKEPEGTVPELLNGYIDKKIMRDMVSAEHPYAALMVPPLAEAAGVEHTNPQYYFVPDDPAFGVYSPLFANKICMLEKHDPTPDDSETKSTAKIINSLIEDNKYHVDQETMLKARLLDMMIGDWDRHFDQWRFGRDSTNKNLFYPIPRDRDNAFFFSDGLFVRSLSIATLPYLHGFRKRFHNINWFNWEERNFDRFFMNNLDRNKWEQAISEFQANETDSVIHDAVKQLPPQIYGLDKKVITEKLKSRRNLLSKEGINYYKFLSKEVNIVGSNKNEYFKVFNKADSLEIKVFKRKKSTDSASVMFDRVFDPAVTKYINLYGLNGEDIFEVDSTANSKIKLRIIGGKGRDTFDIKGKVRNTIYDFSYDSNYVRNTSKSTVDISTDPAVNLFDITGYNYNSYRIPLLSVAYNEEDRLIAGIGYSLKTYGFRKAPYSTYQRITGTYGFRPSAYQLNYFGEFNHVIKKHDIVASGELYNSVLNNFFGLGNETKIRPGTNANFYKVRYNYLSGDLLLRKRFHNLAEISFGPSYYHYWNHYYDNKGKILSQPAFVGLDSADIYSNKSYAGAKINIAIHNPNRDLLPTRGVIWNTEFSSLFGLNKSSRQITKITSDMEVYASFRDPTRLVTVLRVGGGHIFSENYEYFQALNLGSNNFLRGFRKDRFSGKSIFYQSIEFRYKLFNSKSYIVPGAVGLLAFNEVGKVWVKDQFSKKWHHSYGAGLYYSPYNFAIVSATIAFGDEGSLFNFSMGTKFNITF